MSKISSRVAILSNSSPTLVTFFKYSYVINIVIVIKFFNFSALDIL